MNRRGVVVQLEIRSRRAQLAAWPAEGPVRQEEVISDRLIFNRAAYERRSLHALLPAFHGQFQRFIARAHFKLIGGRIG